MTDAPDRPTPSVREAVDTRLWPKGSGFVRANNRREAATVASPPFVTAPMCPKDQLGSREAEPGRVACQTEDPDGIRSAPLLRSYQNRLEPQMKMDRSKGTAQTDLREPHSSTVRSPKSNGVSVPRTRNHAVSRYEDRAATDDV